MIGDSCIDYILISSEPDKNSIKPHRDMIVPSQWLDPESSCSYWNCKIVPHVGTSV